MAMARAAPRQHGAVEQVEGGDKVVVPWRR